MMLHSNFGKPKHITLNTLHLKHKWNLTTQILQSLEEFIVFFYSVLSSRKLNKRYMYTVGMLLTSQSTTNWLRLDMMALKKVHARFIEKEMQTVNII